MKTKTHLKSTLFLALILGLLTFSACQPDEPEVNPFENFELISETQRGDLTLGVYSEKALFAGYNTIYFEVTKGETFLENANLNFTPIMDMGAMKHSCPFEQPVLNTNGVYEAKVLFQMPSMEGTWTLNLDVNDAETNISESFEIPVSVIQPEFSRVIVTSSVIDQKRLIIGYVEPNAPIVGANSFKIAIYTMENMMSFVPVNYLAVEIEPEMPSMGHGSNGNINPVFTNNGMYEGTVSFNMTGDWRIHLALNQDNELVKDGIYFDLFFQ